MQCRNIEREGDTSEDFWVYMVRKSFIDMADQQVINQGEHYSICLLFFVSNCTHLNDCISNPLDSKKYDKIVLFSTFIRDFLMNLEEYLSFVSLSLAQTEEKRYNTTYASRRDYLDMGEQEKFYHYITLKRWMADYQKNQLVTKEIKCECLTPSNVVQALSPQLSLGPSSKSLGHSMQIQQKNSTKGSDANQTPNMLFIFFKGIQHKFMHNRKEIVRFMKKLKLKITLEDFEIWVKANCLDSERQYSPLSIKPLTTSTKNRQESLLLRVLLRKFLKYDAYRELLASQNINGNSLKDSLSGIRTLYQQLFAQKK